MKNKQKQRLKKQLKKVIKFLVIILAYCSPILWPIFLHAQGDDTTHYYPKLNQKIKDFTFTDLQNFDQNQVSISEFKGKWLILDFWTSGCKGCIASFPKMSELQEKFKSELNVLMVGVYENRKFDGVPWEKMTKNIYTYHKKLHNLKFPVAFDTLAYDYFDVSGTPTILVVNPEGTVVAKCRKIDSVSFTKLMNGEKADLVYAQSQHEISQFQNYDFNLPLLTNGVESKGGIDTSYLFRSLLVKYDPDKMPRQFVLGWEEPGRMLNSNIEAQAIGVPLDVLITTAYSDKWDVIYPNIILETKDTLAFFSKGNDNRYAYSLKARKGTSAKKKRMILLDDIKKYFDLDISIKNREVLVYKLIVSDSSKIYKLKVGGGKPGYWTKQGISGFELIDSPISSLINDTGLKITVGRLTSGSGKQPLPLIDATGIKTNISLKFKGDVIDFSTAKENLNKYGLDLVPGKIEMPSIVVSDLK